MPCKASTAFAHVSRELRLVEKTGSHTAVSNPGKSHSAPLPIWFPLDLSRGVTRLKWNSIGSNSLICIFVCCLVIHCRVDKKLEYTSLLERTVACRSCGSRKQGKFPAEIAVHFSGLDDLEKPAVFLFPQLLICFHCGAAEFTVPEAELRLLENAAPPESDSQRLVGNQS
jgi:hypothetical protein